MRPPQTGQNDRTAPGPRSSPSEAGFSVIEGLIAALLLLVVTLGILPLFSRSMNNNVKGNDSTRQSNGATDAFETSLALPFNSGAMTVPPGATSVVVTDTIALKKFATPSGGDDQAMSKRWELLADLDSYDVPVMNRTRTLQQFSFDDFIDNQVFDTPRNGNTEARIIQFKTVDVALQDATGFSSQPYRLRIIQAY